MQKATTIKEIYTLFKPEEFLTDKSSEFYVDIFADDMQHFNDRLEWNENENETIFIAGQPGNGKSTALRLLPHTHKELLTIYDILYLNGRDKFDPVIPTDAVDVVLTIGFVFANKSSQLRELYVAKLEELKAQKIGELQKIEEASASSVKEEKTSMDSGFKIDLKFLKIGADFEDNFRLDEGTKTTTRKLLKSKKKDFLDITNEIIKKYRQTLKDNKKILLVIDDIEKLKDSDHIFTHDIGTLLQIECVKIITMPIHLKRSETFAGQTARELSIKLKEKSEDKCLTENIELLREIVKKRIDDKLFSTLMSDEALDKMVLMSGGNIRQLIKLVKESALKAKSSNSISLGDVESVIYDLKKQYSSATQIMQKFLEDIRENNQPKDYDEESIRLLAKATKDQMIFSYHNSESWYDINPIIANKEPCIIR